MKPSVVKSVVVIGFVLALAWLLLDPGRSAAPETIKRKPLLASVLAVTPQTRSVVTRVEGVAEARWPITLLASVDGRVTRLPEQTEPGELLTSGQLLLAVQDNAYLSNLRGAQARAARAELELAQNKHQKTVATKISKGNKLTAFGRYEPHIKATQAELSAARAEIDFAQQKLDDTTVEAPFAAVVLEKTVTPGQWVNSGDPLFKLAASDYVDIKVALSAAQWLRVGQLAAGSAALVETREGRRWPAEVRYLNPVVDAATRQRSVMLQIRSPYVGEQPLLPGEQVTVMFDGPALQHAVTAPASVLNQDGRVWSVVDGVLQEESIELFDEQSQSIIFRYRDNPDLPRQLVRYPLSRMLNGQPVVADVVNSDAGDAL